MSKNKHLSQRISRKKMSPLQTLVSLAVVIISVIAVIFIIVALLSNTEKDVNHDISTLATDYYENYLFKQISDSKTPENTAEILEKYKDTGFSVVYLRQLLYYKNNDTETINRIKKYCDENKTSIRFYPEPPYTKTSYRIEYNLNCDFEK